MSEKSFDKFTLPEAQRAVADSVQFVIQWVRHCGIEAGSTADYDLYRAVQRAIRSEWEKATGRRFKAAAYASDSRTEYIERERVGERPADILDADEVG